MNAKECLETRRSVRSYKPDPIPVEVINEIVETAKYAPSWKNTQIVRYHVVTNQTLKETIANTCVCGFTFNTKTLLQAPAIVILSYVTGRCGYERDGSFTTPRKDTWQMFDAGVASEAFCLAAYEKGLGTVIMGIFDGDAISSLLQIPDDRELIALIPTGYADEAPSAPRRKAVEELLSFQE